MSSQKTVDSRGAKETTDRPEDFADSHEESHLVRGYD